MPYVRRSLAVLAIAVVSHAVMGQVSMSVQMNKPESPVIGLPFSAEQSISTVQHLANGTPLKAEIKGRVYRSSEGIERYEGAMPATPDRPEPTTMVYILDRTKHTAVLLNTKLKTATIEHLPDNASVSVKFLPLPQSHAVVKPEQVTTNLGKRTQGMITLVGKRVTGTIASGKIGNDQPLTIITDVWVDPQMKLKINEVEQNPLTGERTFELSNIRGIEPDPALFEIPEGYKVTDNPPMPSTQPNTTVL